jgi:adenine deaminase
VHEQVTRSLSPLAAVQTASSIVITIPADLTRRMGLQAYDLIIKGGHVIDPSLRINEVRDVAISGGRIAAVEANISGDATETIDAR